MSSGYVYKGGQRLHTCGGHLLHCACDLHEAKTDGQRAALESFVQRLMRDGEGTKGPGAYVTVASIGKCLDAALAEIDKGE